MVAQNGRRGFCGGFPAAPSTLQAWVGEFCRCVQGSTPWQVTGAESKPGQDPSPVPLALSGIPEVPRDSLASEGWCGMELASTEVGTVQVAQAVGGKPRARLPRGCPVGAGEVGVGTLLGTPDVGQAHLPRLSPTRAPALGPSREGPG